MTPPDSDRDADGGAYRCDACGEEFDSEAALWEHVADVGMV